LKSMQKSAKFLDDFLTGLNNFTFGLTAQYKPDIPLNVTIGQASASLDAVPSDLETMQGQLKDTAANFEALQKDTDQLAADFARIKTNLSDATTVVNDYQQIVKESQDRLNAVRSRVRAWIRIAAWASTAFMVWLLLAQFSLFTQGLDLLNRKFTQGRGR
jgi:hypothetical protein